MKKFLVAVVLLAATALVACGSSSPKPVNKPKTRYTQNYTERKIANERIAKTDDPAHVEFCTFWPPTPGAKPITVPIAGKLVSSTKRPDDPLGYDGTDGGGLASFNRADAQGMYGSSVPYRYGYTPGDIGWEFPADNTTCSDAPTKFQADNTLLVSATDNKLAAAQQEAQAVLREGLVPGGKDAGSRYTPEATRKAGEIIDRAIAAAGGK